MATFPQDYIGGRVQKPMPLQVFDPKQDYAVTMRRLPHWSQASTISFITWRTWDSIPEDVLINWLNERDDWLMNHGIDPVGDWRGQLQSLAPHAVREFQRTVSDRWNDRLDECRGKCVLRHAAHAAEVANSLLHFHGDRYELTDFVVMPNHVHVLVAFPDERSMLDQCESWKRYTAVRINRALGRKGRFWQQDGCDHLVRTVDQFKYLRRYIADNPLRARLEPGEFVHWTQTM